MFDHHEYEVLEAEAFLKGEARGLASGMKKGAQQEREKADAEYAARDSKMAEFFRSKGVSEEIISEGFALKQATDPKNTLFSPAKAGLLPF